MIRRAAIVMAGMLTLAPLSAGGAEPGEPLPFFDPDANQDMLLKVTKLLNDLFERRSLGVTFSPVQSPESLASFGKIRHAILSSQFPQVWKQFNLEPILVPEASGSVYYQKVLVIPGSSGSTDLTGKVIAAAVAPEHTNDVETLLTKKGIKANGIYVLTVQKDIDAIFAVTFGEAQAALVTAESVDALRDVNRRAAEQLKVAARTDNILRAPLCRAKDEKELSDAQLIAFFQSLGDSVEGKEVLQLMSISQWVPFKGSMLK